MVKAQTQSPKINQIEMIVHLLSFAVLSFALLPLIFNLHPGLEGLLIFLLCASFYALVTASLLAILRERASAKLIIIFRVIACIVSLAAFYLAFGLVQDDLGTRCTGFFGSRESCVESARFTISLLLFNPVVLIPATITLSVMIALGLRDANQTTVAKKRK